MKIYFYKYELKRKSSPNAVVASAFQEGALIKIEDEDGHSGYADLCPWPALGDLTVEQELFQVGPLFRRSLTLALTDLAARKNKTSLIQNVKIKNHKLVNQLADLNASLFRKYKYVKIKGSKNISGLSSKLNQLHDSINTVRIDFNNVLTEDEFRVFLASLHPSVLKKIETIEDPFYFNKNKWKAFLDQVNLSVDFQKYQSSTDAICFSDDEGKLLNSSSVESMTFGEKEFFQDLAAWPFQVTKPVRQSVDKAKTLYCTSAMDHPVGVVHGMIAAFSAQPQTVHGFQTVNMYESDKFTSYFQPVVDEASQSADILLSLKPNGTGIGFDEELQSLDWQPYINFNYSAESQVLFNPRSDAELLKLNQQLANKIQSADQEPTKQVSQNYFLIESSGSSKLSEESSRFYALKKENILKSARRVVDFFNLKNKNWGCLLPVFHVSGLGTLARCYISEGRIYFSNWGSFNVDWLIKHNINVLSLVPTQVYDLVRRQMSCPSCIECVFIGGSALSMDLKSQALQLGWPLVETFGMTETAAMVAYKKLDEDVYRPIGDKTTFAVSEQDSFLSDGQIGFLKEGSGNLVIHCDSLADFEVRYKNECLDLKLLKHPLVTSDKVQLSAGTFQFLGRESDFVKINGEGVSLAKLRQVLDRSINQLLNGKLKSDSATANSGQTLDPEAVNNTQAAIKPKDLILLGVPDLRSGHKLLLVYKNVDKEFLISVIEVFNQQVQKYEKISWILKWNKEIEVTDLKKIKYGKLQQEVLLLEKHYEKI